MQLALVLPPLTQLNAPYPATAYLARALRDNGVACTQRDLGIEWILRLYSREGLTAVFDHLDTVDDLPEPAWRAIARLRQGKSPDEDDDEDAEDVGLSTDTYHKTDGPAVGR